MTNASNGHAMNRKLGEWVKRELLGLVKPERVAVKLEAGQLDLFSGTYDVIGQTYKIEAQVQDGQLVLVIPNTTSGGTENLTLRFIAPSAPSWWAATLTGSAWNS